MNLYSNVYRLIYFTDIFLISHFVWMVHLISPMSLCQAHIPKWTHQNFITILNLTSLAPSLLLYSLLFPP